MVSYRIQGEVFPIHREPWLLQNLGIYLSDWIAHLDRPLPLEEIDADQVAIAAVLLNTTYMSHAGQAAMEALERLLGRTLPPGTTPWNARTKFRAFDLLGEAGGEPTRIAFVLNWWPQPWFVAYRSQGGFSVLPVEVADYGEAFRSALAFIEGLKPG